jgi:hypothetical protein
MHLDTETELIARLQTKMGRKLSQELKGELERWLTRTDSRPPFDEGDVDDACTALKQFVAANGPRPPVRESVDALELAAVETDMRLRSACAAVEVEEWRRVSADLGLPHAHVADIPAWIEAQPRGGPDEWSWSEVVAYPGREAVSRIGFWIPSAASVRLWAGPLGAAWRPSPRADAPIEARIGPPCRREYDFDAGPALGLLWRAARSIAAAVGCSEDQAVGHLLTGWPVLVPPVTVNTTISWKMGSFMTRTEEVTRNFSWVTDDMVSQAIRRNGRRRQPPQRKTLELLNLVGPNGPPTVEKYREWCARFPDWPCTLATFRSRYYAARKDSTMRAIG